MRRFLTFFTCFALLTGCGAGDRAAPWRPVLVYKEKICFSVDKNDILSRYNVSFTEGGKYKEFASTQRLSLSYPASCVKIALSPGYTYGVSYTLNNINYRYVFFIDPDWNVQRYQ